MSSHEFFRSLGLYTHPGFLTLEECAQLLDEVNRAEGAPAMVYRRGETLTDEQNRKTLQVSLSEPTRKWLTAKLLSIGSDIERLYDVRLQQLTELGCLVYRPGDFFKIHTDTAKVETEEHKQIETRKVSIVVFLNSRQDQTNPFQGGEINFYGLMEIPNSDAYGFSLDPEPGMLVAFRSTTLHGISEVTEGTRYTLVGWLH